MSQRRACNAIEADRSSVRYRSLRPDDSAVRARLRELAGLRRRFGYRRLGILLAREGITMNHKKLRRLYADAGHLGLYREENQRAAPRNLTMNVVLVDKPRSTA